MPITQNLIAQTLTNIETLLSKIMLLKQEAATLKTELTEVSEGYKRKLGVLNNDAKMLRERVRALRSRLTPPASAHPFTPSGSVLSPPPPPPPPPVNDQSAAESEDPRFQHKVDLADYLLTFIDRIDTSQQVVMERINAMVADENRDVGEMLEIIPWGVVWTLQTDGEMLETQLVRLQGWQRELEGRVAFWEQAIEQLQKDDYYWLLEEKRTHDPEDWQTYLDELARHQEQENARQRDVVAALERECEARHA